MFIPLSSGNLVGFDPSPSPNFVGPCPTAGKSRYFTPYPQQGLVNVPMFHITPNLGDLISNRFLKVMWNKSPKRDIYHPLQIFGDYIPNSWVMWNITGHESQPLDDEPPLTASPVSISIFTRSRPLCPRRHNWNGTSLRAQSADLPTDFAARGPLSCGRVQRWWFFWGWVLIGVNEI